MTSLLRALTTGAATHLHQQGVGFFVDGPIPSGTDWPIYLYEWGKADEQIVVNYPLITGDALTYDTSLQVLVRARTDETAEQKAAQAATALIGTYRDWGDLTVSAVHFTSLARLGKDQNGRAMWVSKLRLYGINR